MEMLFLRIKERIWPALYGLNQFFIFKFMCLLYASSPYFIRLSGKIYTPQGEKASGNPENVPNDKISID